MAQTVPLAVDVAVIGAGISGLTTARTILEQEPGLRVCVLESRERVGGRTQSLDIPGCSLDRIDVGGQWVGPLQTNVLGLVKEAGLQLVKQGWFEDDWQPAAGKGEGDGSPRLVEPHVTTASMEGARSLEAAGTTPGITLISGGSTGLSEVDQTELQSLVTNLDQMAASLGAVPWRQWSEQHPQAREWDQLSVTQWLDRHVTHKAVAEEIILFTQAVLSGPPESISFLFLLFYIFSSGGMHQLADVDGGAQTWRIQGGSQQLSQFQAQQVTRLGGQVLLSHPVTSIAQRPHPTPRLLLTLGNGSQLLASCVVVAVPPPVWHATIQFSPPLSAERQQLGRAMFMGAAMKFVIFYSHAFWREPRLLAPTCKLDACGPVQNLYPACFEGTPALIGLATGRSALLLNAASEAEQREQVLQQLVLYWGSSQARDAVTTFTAKSWAQEPWSRGCFTALMPPGLATSPAGRSLREPEYAGQLLFAGTETAVNWYGYIEGGMQAGMEAGKQAVALAARLKEVPLVASKL